MSYSLVTQKEVNLQSSDYKVFYGWWFKSEVDTFSAYYPNCNSYLMKILVKNYHLQNNNY